TEVAENREVDDDECSMDQGGEELSGGEDVEGTAHGLQSDQDHRPPGAPHDISALAVAASNQDEQCESQQPEQAGEGAVQHLNAGQRVEAGQDGGATEE